jgi:ABC-type transport system involved in multi-copper enzyme maturation permease subunit
MIAFSKGARVPFADLSNATVWKYLPASMIESLLLDTVLTVAAAYLAVAIFKHEIEDRSLFFLFEQPIPRKQYVAVKFLHGALHVVLATCFAALLAPAVVYAMMLLSGKVTTASSGAAFAAVMAAAARTGIWCSLMALMVFTGSALVSALVPRFWLAATVSVVLLTLFGLFSGDFFDIPFQTGEPLSVSANISSQWITISRALTPGEVADLAHWKAWPLLTAVLLAAVFSVATALLYDRKELK